MIPALLAIALTVAVLSLAILPLWRRQSIEMVARVTTVPIMPIAGEIEATLKAMYCQACGGERVENERVCGHCGQTGGDAT